MKKNNIFKIFVAIFVIVIGIGKVNAVTPIVSQSSGCYAAEVRPVITVDKTHITSGGPTYNIGDLISVELNTTETKSFYVIENSATGVSSVKAILKGFLGSPVPFLEVNGVMGSGGTCTPADSYEDSYIKTVVDSRTSTWSNVTSVGLITLEQIANVAGVSTATIESSTQNKNVSYNFNASLPINSSSKYWTAKVAVYQPHEYPCDALYINGNGNTPGGTSQDTVKNPETGITSPYIIGGLAVIGIVAVILANKKKNYFTKV